MTTFSFMKSYNAMKNMSQVNADSFKSPFKSQVFNTDTIDHHYKWLSLLGKYMQMWHTKPIVICAWLLTACVDTGEYIHRGHTILPFAGCVSCPLTTKDKGSTDINKAVFAKTAVNSTSQNTNLNHILNHHHAGEGLEGI